MLGYVCDDICCMCGVQKEGVINICLGSISSSSLPLVNFLRVCSIW